MDTVRDWLLAHDAIVQWEDRECGVKSAAVQHTQRQDRGSETGEKRVGDEGKPTMKKNLQLDSGFFKLYLHAPYLIQPR